MFRLLSTPKKLVLRRLSLRVIIGSGSLNSLFHPSSKGGKKMDGLQRYRLLQRICVRLELPAVGPKEELEESLMLDSI